MTHRLIYYDGRRPQAHIANLVVDTLNNRVGIGTTSPSANLHVVGNVHASSDITTNASLEATDGTDGTRINQGSIELCRSAGNPFIDFKNQISDGYDFRIIGTNSATGLMFRNNTQDYLSIDDTDKVKIYSNLHVSGTIITDGGGIELIKTDSSAYIDFKNSSGEDYDFRIQQDGSGYGKLKFISANAGRNLTFDGQFGSFGCNLNNPVGSLHVKQRTDDTGGDLTYYGYAAINIERNNNGNRWSLAIPTNNDLSFYYNANKKAIIRDNGTDDTNLNFTGQHRCFNQFSNVSNLAGLIVCSKSNKYVNFDFSQSPTINECLPVISLSNVAYDKSCFGVISGKEDAGTRTTSSGTVMSFLPQESGDNRVFVNSLGEGAIWVSNLNGNLESGDYITTSNIAGYGQKQDSEFLANYTVAKITMDCNFNPQMVPKRVIQKDQDGNNVLDSNGNLILEDSDEMISEYEVKILDDGTKVAFVGCTYHCG